MAAHESSPAVESVGLSRLMEESAHVPVLLAVCCICGLVRDDASSSHEAGRWIPLKTYRHAHQLYSADVLFSHTYCPHCLVQVQERVRLYAHRRGSIVMPSTYHMHDSLESAFRGSALALVLTFVGGCATTKDLDALRAQVSDQVAAVRIEGAQSRQVVEALKTDVTLLKSLGVVVDTLKGRLDGMQSTVQTLQTEAESHRTTIGNLRVDFKEFKVAHEGVARETDRLRISVGSLEQGMMHQLQMEVTLARERIKQLEQMMENLQKAAPPPKDREGGTAPRL